MGAQSKARSTTTYGGTGNVLKCTALIKYSKVTDFTKIDIEASPVKRTSVSSVNVYVDNHTILGP